MGEKEELEEDTDETEATRNASQLESGGKGRGAATTEYGCDILAEPCEMSRKHNDKTGPARITRAIVTVVCPKDDVLILLPERQGG